MTPQKDQPAPRPTYEALRELYNVPARITIVVGRTHLTIGSLLQLERGSIVELSKSAGESFDILVNGRLAARGDVTVMEDRFGIRVNEIIDLDEGAE